MIIKYGHIFVNGSDFWTSAFSRLLPFITMGIDDFWFCSQYSSKKNCKVYLPKSIGNKELNLMNL
nr:hypothetical protein Iba_chr01aCG3490 [Ipomoea batatas]